MRTSLHSSGRLGRAGALRNPGTGRAGAWIAGVVALGLALAALAIFTAAHDRAVSAEDLMRLTLVGPRPLTCERIVVLPDVSGSMTDYAKVRENAMSTLAAWAPINLRIDDQLAIVRWADTAAIDAQPTEVSSMAASTFTPGTADVGGGNDIVPSVEEVASMSETSCHTSLNYISDGEITTYRVTVNIAFAIESKDDVN